MGISFTPPRIDDLLAPLGPKDAVLAEMAGLDEDFEAFHTFRAQLVSEHAGEWIAVYHGELKARDPDLDRVVEQLETQQLPIWRVVIQPVTHIPRGALPPLRA